MRICMLGYTFYEIDSRVRQYAEALVERGDEVDFIGLGGEGQPAKDAVGGVRVFRIQRRDFREKGKISYLFRLLRFLISSMVFLSRKHLRRHYDLIHIHSVPDFLVFAAWFPKLTGAKIILDIHDVVPEFYATKFNVPLGSTIFKLLLLMEKLSARFANHVIIANDIWRQKLISRSVPPSACTTVLNYPIHVVPHGRADRRNDSQFVILYPGTLNHHQGADVAVRAFAAIQDKIPGAQFQIYGQGAEFENISRLIQELCLQEKILLRPQVSHEEILRVIENSDLGVDPKRTDGFADEAFGGKIFEFMALGVPMVVSNTRANRYYFNDSVVRFCRGGDVEDLARSILELYEDKNARRQMVRNAVDFICAYDWAARKSDYFKLVDSLIHDSKKMPARKSQSVL